MNFVYETKVRESPKNSDGQTPLREKITLSNAWCVCVVSVCVNGKHYERIKARNKTKARDEREREK